MPKNPYPGVDAHLNSALLHPGGGWESFHANHTIRIQDALNAELPEAYYALAERSLQITRAEEKPATTTRPDVGVFREVSSAQSAETTLHPTATAPTRLLLADDPRPDDETDLSAVNLYTADDEHLVARIEVLSPSNKPGGSYHTRYLMRRWDTFRVGVNLIELDYLHTTKPIVPAIPSYPQHEAEATPYYVLVTDPRVPHRPLYAVEVDEPLPKLEIPLHGSDTVVLDLQGAYNATVEGVRAFSLRLDYGQQPVGLDAFSEADQQTIFALMTGFGS